MHNRSKFRHSNYVRISEFIKLRPSIIEALEGNKVVIYNAEFDIGFLSEIETHAAEIWCCMKSWADSYNAGRWQKLTVVAKAVGYQFNAHRAFDDCLATRAVWQYLMAKRKRVKAKPKPRYTKPAISIESTKTKPPSDYPWIPKQATKHKPSIGRRIWTALCWFWFAAIWFSLKFAGFVLGI